MPVDNSVVCFFASVEPSWVGLKHVKVKSGYCLEVEKVAACCNQVANRSHHNVINIMRLRDGDLLLSSSQGGVPKDLKLAPRAAGSIPLFWDRFVGCLLI